MMIVKTLIKCVLSRALYSWFYLILFNNLAVHLNKWNCKYTYSYLKTVVMVFSEKNFEENIKLRLINL